MEFRIADTFTDSLAKQTAQDQKAAKTTAFDLQMDPSRPGMQFHRIERARDDNFWSVRVNRDIRLIIHKTDRSFLLCYVGHHDDAYAWAERRKIERHPRTGAAQIVEIRETVREIPVMVQVEQPAPPLFEHVTDEDLLDYGVPEEWLETVRQSTEDTILDVVDHLPSEAAEALLDLAVGATPAVAIPLAEEEDPFEHPDAQRRFRTIEDQEELERALNFPWDKWAVFLHPAQKRLVARTYNGSARVAGSAGTGKTVVALHRAVHLVERNPDARVLLTTFSDPLARALKDKLRTLISNRPRLAERLDVEALDGVALRLYRAVIGPPQVATDNEVGEILEEAAAVHEPHGLSASFLRDEWKHVVDAWQLDTWEAYRDVPRIGRKTRLAQSRREVLWTIFQDVRAALDARGLLTMPVVYGALTRFYDQHPPPYEHAVVDEAQDVSVAQLRFLSALAGDHAEGLFFSGDLGQRIFQPPFSWMSLGVDIRGRSHTLRINYRTSHQIRRQADRLLGFELADVDGIVEDRRGAMSVFNGPEPAVRVVASEDEETQLVADWLMQRVVDGVSPEEVGVFVRSEAEIDRARTAVEMAGLPHRILDDRMRPGEGRASISTMHLAKGLEFRAVVVMACDDEVIPLQSRIESIGDEADIDEVYATERHLLYVACTRARDRLLVTGVEPGSEFLDDLLN